MASPTPRREKQESRHPPPRKASPAGVPPEVIDPRWLFKALGLTITAAVVLAYLAVCLLVYQGGWQLMLHPAGTVDATPSAPFQPLRFDAVATGTPRLSGWWIPAESSNPTTPTILFLHDGQGSLSTTVRKLDLLHRANVNILAFDYRGYGQSSPPHPTEARMVEDSAAALDYLENTRHIRAASIVPYGEGLGAVLAADLSNTHPDLPAFIADSPDPGAFDRAAGSGRARLMPMSLLVQEHFGIAAAMARSGKPKLLLTDSPFGSDSARVNANQDLFRSIPDPKMTVSFARIDSGDLYLQSVTRFLDQYLPAH